MLWLVTAAWAGPCDNVTWISPGGAPVVIEWEEGDGGLYHSGVSASDAQQISGLFAEASPPSAAWAHIDVFLTSQGYTPAQGVQCDPITAPVAWSLPPGTVPASACSHTIAGGAIAGVWALCVDGPTDGAVAHPVEIRPQRYGEGCLGIEPLAVLPSGERVVASFGPGGAMDGGMVLSGLPGAPVLAGYTRASWARQWTDAGLSGALHEAGAVPEAARCSAQPGWAEHGVERIVTLSGGVALAAPGRALVWGAALGESLYDPDTLRLLVTDDGDRIVAGRGYGAWWVELAPVAPGLAPRTCAPMGAPASGRSVRVYADPDTGAALLGVVPPETLHWLGESSCATDGGRSFAHVQLSAGRLGWVLASAPPPGSAPLPLPVLETP